jgi:hypothetical protein
MSEWIKVQNLMPPVCEEVLIALSTGRVTIGSRLRVGWDWPDDGDEGFDVRVTHWRTIPAPPIEDQSCAMSSQHS